MQEPASVTALAIEHVLAVFASLRTAEQQLINAHRVCMKTQVSVLLEWVASAPHTLSRQFELACSLGRLRLYILLEGPSSANSDDVILEVKQARPSLSRHSVWWCAGPPMGEKCFAQLRLSASAADCSRSSPNNPAQCFRRTERNMSSIPSLFSQFCYWSYWFTLPWAPSQRIVNYCAARKLCGLRRRRRPATTGKKRRTRRPPALARNRLQLLGCAFLPLCSSMVSKDSAIILQLLVMMMFCC